MEFSKVLFTSLMIISVISLAAAYNSREQCVARCKAESPALMEDYSEFTFGYVTHTFCACKPRPAEPFGSCGDKLEYCEAACRFWYPVTIGGCSKFPDGRLLCICKSKSDLTSAEAAMIPQSLRMK